MSDAITKSSFNVGSFVVLISRLTTAPRGGEICILNFGLSFEFRCMELCLVNESEFYSCFFTDYIVDAYSE